MKTVLSGIQPSGKLHLGNYLGATRQHVEMQEKFKCIYLIADLHALTTVRDPEQMRSNTLDLAMDYLALGIDPEKTIFFKQSDVTQHAELTWIFDCITPIGLLERAHAWKDAEAKKIKEMTAGLFNYPVLMAADILVYRPDLVPVGKDQKQHIEIARDIAMKFNEHFGETLPMPQDYIKPEVAVVPGTDGQKMSKSYKNTIDIFAEESVLKKQVMGIVTDSKGINEPKDPATCIPYLLYKHLASSQEAAEMELQLTKGGTGYGDIKKTLLAKILEYFAQAREKRTELIKKPDEIYDILSDGAKKARVIASKTMEEVKRKVGLTAA
ncbi:MAG: tryptophan--tRNA ligase [Patescibacteria group bacterium]